MTDDPDLRTRLERLASSAGDPPEQGLEKVAARRHRRLRRRRGAVVTAAALAVLLIGVSTVVEGGGRPDDVAVSRADRSSAGKTVQLPNKVVMHCGPRAIEILVASVRPQRDGLHVRVVNDQPTSTEVWVVNSEEGWSSGPVSVDPGPTNLRVPVPPGVLTIGCRVAASEEQRRVDLDDVDHYYRPPELVCDDGPIELHDLVIDKPASMAKAAEDALTNVPGWPDGVTAGPVRGYSGQRLGDPTDDPVVQVERDGEPVAFVHLRGRDGEPKSEWTTATLVVGCRDFLADAEVSTTTKS